MQERNMVLMFGWMMVKAINEEKVYMNNKLMAVIFMGTFREN